jgi:DNA-binding NtrC family response regulator
VATLLHFFLLPPLTWGFVGLCGGNVAEKPIANSTILAVFSAWEDRTSLASIFAHSNWKLRFTGAFPQAQIELSESQVGVVISEARLSDGHCWKDLLNEIRGLEDPLPLIVADRLADERLWSEVLNLGAYDLLAKPFDAREVLHAVTTACRRVENERGLRKPAVPEQRGSGAEMSMNAAIGR